VGTMLESASRKAANAATVILSWSGLFAVWLAGLLLVFFYQGIVTFKMYRLLKAGRRAEGKERIYIVRNLSSPCLWGLFRPVICLPESLEETEWDYILCHERCHKRRGDHIAKWVLFLITAVHWFNPFIWLAYSFCCKDMEISCDEAVLGQAGEDVRKAYAASLLKYAARQNGYLFAPLTFGEPSLRSRVSNILHYRKRGAFVCGAALVIVLLTGAGLFLWAGNRGAGNTEESTGLEEATEANISGDEEAEDYQITGILTGAYGVCSYDSSSEDKEFISELLWLAPRRYDHVDGTDYMEVIAYIDSLKESWDETGSYVTYTEDLPVFIRYYMESYVAPDGVNAIDHKDIILLQEGDDMVVCIQRPDDESKWIFYLAPDYGDWLLKEVELRYRISFPELFSETSASDQEETSLSDEERYSGMLVSREEYPELYEAAEALLEAHEASAAQRADETEKMVDSDSIHIFREGLSDEVFVITATVLTGLTSDDEVRLSFGVRLNEDSAYGMEIVNEIEVADDDTQERLTAFVQYIMENVAGPVYMGYQLIYMDDDTCPELIVSGPDEATGFLILHYNDGTVYATQSNRLYYSYIPYGNLLLNAEGNMGLYTDDVYSIVDGQVTLIATGYRGLWAMNDGEIEWSGNNLDEDRYYWEGEELSEEEYAAALEAVYPSEQAVECDDIPYYSYREIVALLDESYLKEIPAPKG
ncbi:MAG: M56 family metallopeptidase, partial [Lachnospiraceae bacterium]|nr:M56 family metallopeptidase [Lachnospiraceae bacterium]